MENSPEDDEVQEEAALPSKLGIVSGDAVQPDGTTEEDVYHDSKVHEDIHEEHDQDVPKDVGEEAQDGSEDNKNKTPNDHLDDSPEVDVQEERASKEFRDVNEETTNTLGSVGVENQTLNDPVENFSEDEVQEEANPEPPHSSMNDNIPALNEEITNTQGSKC